MIIGIIFVGIDETHTYFKGEEESNYKCYKYINNEHKEFVLFEDLDELKKFFLQHPTFCEEDFSIDSKKGRKIKFETIRVELIEDEIDSTFVKIKYRENLFKREYYTLKCFINKYSPEDFSF